MSDIFVSYASEDRERIMPLVRALEKMRWSVFWDRTIPIGKTWREVIGKEVRICRAIVVVWSERSVESKWVQMEAEEGEHRNVLFPVLIDDVPLPFGFSGMQTANLDGWDGASETHEFRRLIADLTALLGEPPAAEESRGAVEKERKQAEEARRKAAEEEKRRTKEEAKRKADENRKKAEEAAQKTAEEEANRKALEEARKAEAAEAVEERKEVERKKARMQRIVFASAVIVTITLVTYLQYIQRSHIDFTLTTQDSQQQSKNEPIGESTKTAPAMQELKRNAEPLSPVTSGDRSAINPDVVAIGKKVLSNLDKTLNTGSDFDYWPDGGIRIAYYHLATFASYETLVRLSPYPVFVSGPHGTRQLNLASRFTFGHYNPEFLRWFQGHLKEILRDRTFVRSTEQLFKTYLGTTAMTYWATYTTLNQHPKELNTLLQEYRTHIDNRTLPEGNYYEIAWEGEKHFVSLQNLYASYDVNVVAPAVYFWLRRYIDGTHQQIYSLLESLLGAYQLI